MQTIYKRIYFTPRQKPNKYYLSKSEKTWK